MAYDGNGPAAGGNDIPVQIQGVGTNDPRADKNWALEYVGAPEAWKTSTGEGIVVAVLDTGVDIGHVDLDDNIWRNRGEIAGDGIDNDRNGFVDDVHGWNFSDDGKGRKVMDSNGHGTHVAGLIAAEKGNGEGIVGVAPDARIMAVKVLGDDGSGSFSDVARGIDYAVENGARIVNLSLSGSSGSSSVRQAIARAEEAGVIVVAAAGNSRKDEAGYPAAYADEFDNVVSVAALTKGGDLASYSNRSKSGDTVDLAAPGSGLESTVPGDGYGSKSGTSMAAPVVAAAAAVIWAAQPAWSYKKVIEVLETTVTSLSSLKNTSATDGALDLAAAVKAAMAGSGKAPKSEPKSEPAPTLEVDMLVTSLEEGKRKEGIRVADIDVDGDGVGKVVLSLSGEDASDFRIRDGGLVLRKRAELDYEADPELNVTITLDDLGRPGGDEDSFDVTIALRDVPESGKKAPAQPDGDAPTDLAGLDFWFDATSLAPGKEAGVLVDLSGNGNDARASGGERGEVAAGGLMLDGGDRYVIDSCETINTGGPYDGKTLSFSIDTGADVDDHQVLYEQGGKKRGLSVTIEDGELHATAWNLAEDRWGAITVSTRIEAGEEMAVSVVLDAEAGTLSGYRDGALFDVETGVGLLHSHGDAIALGGVNGQARGADGQLGDGAGRFEGTIFEAASHGRALEADEIAGLHGGFAGAWDAGDVAAAVLPAPFRGDDDVMVFTAEAGDFLM
jgi:hypothetical protein